ncbi:Cyclic nucleotide-binding domain protein [compost metagenome]
MSRDAAGLEQLLATGTLLDLEKGDRLFLRGEPAHAFYFVISGAVKIYLLTPDSQEKVLEVVGHARCIEVFTVVAGAVQLDVLGPAELVLQAEQQQAATAGVPPGTLGTGMPCVEVSVNGATSLPVGW